MPACGGSWSGLGQRTGSLSGKRGPWPNSYGSGRTKGSWAMPGDDVAEILKPRTFDRTARAAEKEAKLPAFDDDYVAAGNPEHGEVSRLVLVMGKEGFAAGATAYRFLQYVHISMGEFM